MFGSQILDVVIGLCMMYLLISLVSTIAVEWLAAYFNWRSANLKTAIKSLLTGSEVVKEGEIDLLAEFYKHPRIKSLSKDGKSEPSAISSSTFADTMINLLLEPGTPANAANEITKKAIEEIDETGKSKYVSYLLKKKVATNHIENVINSMIAKPKMEIDQFRESLEQWYDETQARAQGWYKKKTHKWNLGIALLVCLALNADTIQMGGRIYRNPALQKALVASASTYVHRSENPGSGSNVEEANFLIETMKKQIGQDDIYAYPIGWKGNCPKDGWAWLGKIVGILLTVFAVSLGSQFWIDTVRQLVELRLGGAKVEKKEPKPAASQG